MLYYNNSRGENIIFSFIKEQPKDDQIKLTRALKGLEERAQNLNIKQFRCNVNELKVGKYRIFFINRNSEICVIHILRKSSAKIQQHDVDLILNRI